MVLVDVIDSINRDADGEVQFHYTLVDLMAEWRAGEAVAADDVAAVRWVTLDDLDDYQLRRITHDVILLADKKRRELK